MTSLGLRFYVGWTALLAVTWHRPLLFLKATQLVPTPGPLHLRCPLPGMLSPAPLPNAHVAAP